MILPGPVWRQYAGMEEGLQAFAVVTALALELMVVLTVLIGAAEAMWLVCLRLIRTRTIVGSRRAIWLRFAGWILLSLEFALGADIIRTAIAPTWDDIGKLAAIAAIRTALSWFLEKDIEDIREAPGEDPGRVA
jgi:uncharacterized membrane protein